MLSYIDTLKYAVWNSVKHRTNIGDKLSCGFEWICAARTYWSKELSKTLTKGSLMICGFTSRVESIYENEAANVNVVSYSPIPEC